MKRVPKPLWILVGLLCFAGLLQATLPQTTIGSWTAANSLSQARSNGSAVLLSNGSILITGGDSGTGPSASAEIFGAYGSISPAASMNTPRSRHFAAVLGDGRVLVAGGETTGGGTTNSAEIYDPSSNSWTQINPLTQARGGATTALLQDGRVFIAGGDNAGNPSNTAEIYDPSTGSFSFAGTLSSPRTKHAAALLQDGRVLIVGGSDGTKPLASSDLFDPATGQISAGPNLATARYAHSATTLLNGHVVVIGGTGSDGNGGTTDLASVEVFDPATGAFGTAGATLTTARAAHQALLLPNNNSVLIFGGTSNGAAVAASELFTPQVSSSNGAWTYTAAASGSNVTPRSSASSSAMKQAGLMLAAGGTDASGNMLASTELYAFPTVKTDASDYAPGSIVTITGSGFTPGETVTLTLVESPLIDTHPTITAVADSNGNISNSQFSPDSHDVNVRFWLTAAGSQSGLVAQNTFTDAAPKNYDALISPTSGTAGTSSTTYTITIENDRTSGNQIGDATIAIPSGFASPTLGTLTQPAGFGWTASLSSGTVTLLANAGSSKLDPEKSVSIAVTVTNPCTVGSNTWTTTAGSSATAAQGDFTLVGSQPAVTITGSCTVSTATSVTSSANPSKYGDSVTFTSIVSPDSGTTTPTGSIAFVIDSGTPIAGTASTCPGSAPANSLCATYSTSSLTVNGGTAHSVQANYTHTGNFVNSSGSLSPGQTVDPKPVVITPTSGQSKVYGASDPTLTFSNDASLAADAFTGALGRVSGENVGTYAINLGNLSAGGNYSLSLSTTPVTFEIEAKPVVITPNTGQFKIYGSTDPVLTFTNDGSLASAAFTGALGRVTGENVGTYAISLGNLSVGSNYSLSLSTTPVTFEIKAKPVVIIPDTGQFKIYGSTDPTLTFTNDGSLASAAFTGVLGRVTGENVGTYAINLGNLSAGSNYSLSLSTTPVTFEIKAKPVVITPNTGQFKIYGSTDPVLTFTNDGSLASAAFTGALGRVSGENVGTYAINLGNLSAGSNYSLSLSTTPVTFEIKAKPVVIIPDTGQHKIYGSTDPTLTFTNDGGLALSAFTGALGRAAGENVGTYAINLSNLSAGSNYSLSLAATTVNFAINPAPVTVSFTAANKNYDSTTVATVSNCQIATGKVGSDDVTCTVANGTFASKNASASSQVVSATATLGGAAAGNYSVTNPVTTTATIGPAPITVTADAQTKIFGQPDPTLTYKVQNGAMTTLFNGDSFGGSLTRDSGDNVGSYAIKEGSLTAGSNYTITYVGAYLTITQASSTTVVMSSLNPSGLGENVTFTATVTDSTLGSTGTPTGTVAFKDGVTTIASNIALNGAGQATFTTSSLSAGTHSITAVYGGDTNFVGSSTTQNLTQAVDFGFLGLFSPYQPPSAGVAYKINSAIPLSWQYTDKPGNVVNSSNANPQVTIAGPYTCGADDTATDVLALSAGGSGYQYDPTTNTWQFNWKTTGLNKGCYNIYIHSNLTNQTTTAFPIQLR